MKSKFIAGIIGSPFGVKGFVKVRPLSGEIDHLLKLKSVILKKDEKERTLQIEESAPSPPFLLIHFEGIDSPETAKTLNGAQLIISREQAAPLGEGEFYIEDLKELPVLSENGEVIGHVTDIIEGGGGELAEIKLTVSGDKHLIPFRKEFFSEINPEKGRLVLQDFSINLLYENNKFSAET
ncbi:MAG: ribosome maturation factor RimM [Treponema sp.]|nr:ribosome maturation factor RimM [Treponema sp.]